jgi:hypothetical protein
MHGDGRPVVPDGHGPDRPAVDDQAIRPRADMAHVGTLARLRRGGGCTPEADSERDDGEETRNALIDTRRASHGGPFRQRW